MKPYAQCLSANLLREVFSHSNLTQYPPHRHPRAADAFAALREAFDVARRAAQQGAGLGTDGAPGVIGLEGPPHVC